ncbi:MAG: hypothetical protein KDB68_06600 [Planctomycetes bacterium]|nr:hypothetical protein [Planctomycetota bacterium]MCA8935859.1 hypothetical protein [Planctomycetota bacterium]
MKHLTFSLLAIALLGVTSAMAQDAGDSQQTTLYLKSGDILTGNVKKVDADGVKLDIGDNIELFIRWDYTRGDKHYELRKSATNFTQIGSVLKLADFCHEFAMDEQEARVLVAALKLEPKNAEVRQRLKELPKVEGLEIPGESETPEVKPDPKGDDPEVKLPPPNRKTWTVYIDMATDEDAVETWMIEQFEEMNYGIGTKSNNEIVVEISVKLTLTKNPKFMGAELYAVYDGELTYKLYKQGESSAFSTETFKKADVRRDTRDEARTRCRTDLCEDAFTAMYAELEKMR